MERRARALVAVPALVFFALTAVHAIRLGNEGQHVAEANGVIEGWSRAETSRADVVSTLRLAEHEVPYDPAPHELQAVVAVRRGGVDADARAAIEQAKLAAQLRPSSPYTWSTLVALEYRLGGTGPVFEAALRNAAELGPSEPEVERDVVDYGLAVWNEVAPDTHRAVEIVVTRAMERDPGGTLRLAAKRGRLAVACRHLPSREDKQWLGICQSTEATS